MEIIIVLHPLYKSLDTYGFGAFLKTNVFGRLCNKLSISDVWAQAQQDAAPASDSLLSMFGPNEQELLGHFLNHLYTRKQEKFFSILTDLLLPFFEWNRSWISVEEIIADLHSIGLLKSEEEKIRNAWVKLDAELLRKVEILKTIIIDKATGGAGNAVAYVALREQLIKQPTLKFAMPSWLLDAPTIDGLWLFIRNNINGYKARRTFLETAFEKMKEALTNPNNFVAANIIINEHYVKQEWTKAVARLTEDPEAAITSARTLLETVCKHILDTLNISYDDAQELPKLYRQTAASLMLAPDQHTEGIFKQILSGCGSVVDGLGALRNKLSDAHGRSARQHRPAARHAALAVNLAGAVASFLLQTMEASLSKNQPLPPN